MQIFFVFGVYGLISSLRSIHSLELMLCFGVIYFPVINLFSHFPVSNCNKFLLFSSQFISKLSFIAFSFQCKYFIQIQLLLHMFTCWCFLCLNGNLAISLNTFKHDSVFFFLMFGYHKTSATSEILWLISKLQVLHIFYLLITFCPFWVFFPLKHLGNSFRHIFF